MAQVPKKETKVNTKTLMKADSNARKMKPLKSQNITKEKIEALLPHGSRHNISEELMELIAKMEDDTGLPQDMMEEEVLGYMHLASKIPRLKLIELVNATKFCNLKRNYDNKKSWSMVFPDKYDKLVSEGRDVDSHVSMYNQSKIVQMIDKEMLIPMHLQYAPYAHFAVKKQYDLANGISAPNADGEAMTVTPMVQHLAAKTLFEMTAMPETAKIDLTVSKSEEEINVQKEMNAQLAELVRNQKMRLDAGESLDSVQQVGITTIDAEIEE